MKQPFLCPWSFPGTLPFSSVSLHNFTSISMVAFSLQLSSHLLVFGPHHSTKTFLRGSPTLQSCQSQRASLHFTKILSSIQIDQFLFSFLKDSPTLTYNLLHTLDLIPVSASAPFNILFLLSSSDLVFKCEGAQLGVCPACSLHLNTFFLIVFFF